MNFIISALVYYIADLDYKKPGRYYYHIHYWYVAPLIFITFKELFLMIKPIRNADFDWVLIKADQFLFGCNPTQALHSIANPFLTELLQLAYSIFYFLPIILCLEFIRKKRQLELDYSLFLVVYGFFLSYLGYFLLPAVGPRFTLHNFSSLNSDLPGLFATDFLREFLNGGESIYPDTLNPAAVVQRDVFPSGHTQMTLITMFLAVKFKSGSRYFLLTAGSLLVFATVYLRYHYVIDVIGGTVFMIITVTSGKFLFNNWEIFTGVKRKI
jgi:membrane-associated phospholipid phosphatase